MLDKKALNKIQKFYKTAKKPVCVQKLMKRLAPDSKERPHFEKQIKKLEKCYNCQFYTYEEMAFICEIFCMGVTYVYNQFNTAPQYIGFFEHPKRNKFKPTICYNRDSKSIGITTTFIFSVYYLEFHFDKYIGKFMCSIEEAFLSGVHEAYHHYQFSRKKKYYDKFMPSYRKSRNFSAYYDNPIETDVQKFYKEVSQKFGFNLFPYNNEEDIGKFLNKLDKKTAEYFIWFCKRENREFKENRVPAKIKLPKNLGRNSVMLL